MKPEGKIMVTYTGTPIRQPADFSYQSVNELAVPARCRCSALRQVRAAAESERW